MNAPSWKNAVFNAVKALASERAWRKRCFSTSAVSLASAAARLITFTPSGSVATDESSGAKWPFTKTSLLPASPANV